MIHINLIPVEQGRRQKKKGLFHAGFMLPREVIIGLIGGFLVLLAVGHIVLQVVIMTNYVQLKHQEEQWRRILPEKKGVDKVVKDLQARQTRYKALKDIRDCADISWAGKLNSLSNALPRGIWLSDIVFEDSTLFVRGSSVSKHNVEKINIYNYVKKLKEDGVLMEGVSSIEVESVKSRLVQETPVADFVIRMALESDTAQDKKSTGKKTGKRSAKKS